MEDEGQGGPASTPFSAIKQTFDHSTGALILPDFLQDHVSMPVKLDDSDGVKLLASKPKSKTRLWPADLHLMYLSYPSLCRNCDEHTDCSCPTYTQLWDRFLTDTSQEQKPKAQLSDQIEQWHSWAYHQREAGLLTPHQASLCAGPARRAHIYDRAVVGQASFTCGRLEESKMAKDSVILTRVEGTLRAGCVTAFLSHKPPGHARGSDTSHEPDLAHVKWYQAVPPAQPSMDAELGCPVFSKVLGEDPQGNICLVQHMIPRKLAALPYQHATRQQVVIVSRFASFLDSNPE